MIYYTIITCVYICAVTAMTIRVSGWFWLLLLLWDWTPMFEAIK